MKILLSGATGYIGKRLLPVLIREGHHVVCCVRDRAQPISIRNVIQFLSGVLLLPSAYGRSFDIGGPDILSYRECALEKRFGLI